MLISLSNRFLLLKNRKVGGTSLEKYILENHFDPKIDVLTRSADGLPNINIGPEVSGHANFWECIGLLNERETPEECGDIRLLGVERNPWDKTVSNYYFHTGMLKDFSGSFEDFLKYYPKAFLSDWSRYAYGLPERKPLIHIIHYSDPDFYDQLKESFRGLIDFDPDKFAEYGMKRGYRPNRPYQDYYNAWSRGEVTRHFENEIEYFGYGFDD